MDRARFEALVQEAIDALPEEFARELDNVAIVIEDEPDAEVLRSVGLDPHVDTLFGLYQGIPLPERGISYSGALPDKISIYYRPLRTACLTPDQLRREIRTTLIHEIGHYFGMDDDEIERLGY
ncbi:metallopeptidase family protein [Candidatus Binatia bacterium]|nr:metallopeptidase family protein [Candidatus Binatia bacterium]